MLASLAPTFQLGDLVHAATDLYNDPLEDTGESSIPGLAPGALIAAAGTRGVVINAGHTEAKPPQALYLVRFETGSDGTLGAPIGCLPEELGYEPPLG